MMRHALSPLNRISAISMPPPDRAIVYKNVKNVPKLFTFTEICDIIKAIHTAASSGEN